MLINFYQFDSEIEAEAVCTAGCPIYGKDLNGNEVIDRGVTTRLANWVKHPTLNKWLIKTTDLPGLSHPTQQYEKDLIYPPSPNPNIN